MKQKDYYALLEVHKHSSKEEIKLNDLFQDLYIEYMSF